MRAKIYSFMKFGDDGLIEVTVDKAMLKVIRDCLEEEITAMCEPETYDQMVQLIYDYKSISDKMNDPIEEAE